MGIPGGTEWLIILLIVLVLFGGKKLPELMGGLGKGIKSFKKGVSSQESDNSPNGETLDGKDENSKRINNEPHS
jgi:sec-independent protein translocase protein TatA